MEDLPQIVATNLRRLRRERGLTQEDLALKSGVDRSYLGNIERAEYSITVVTLGRLAIALEVVPSRLLELPEGHPMRKKLQYP